MKERIKSQSFFLFFILIQLFFCSSDSFFGGSWCSYQSPKYIPCKVKNGTESYIGPKMCWKSINGSFSCKTRIIQKPKYITTLKKVMESKYKCCPGLYGRDCQDECFNCTTIQLLEKRIGKLEKLSKKEPIPLINDWKKGNEGNENKVPNILNSILDERESISSLKNTIREMDIRIKTLESELTRLVRSVSTSTSVSESVVSSGSRSLVKEDEVKKEGESSERTLIDRRENKNNLNNHSIRILEKNLERGDIASTLNDDYDEENISLLSTDDEYVDQLYNIIN